MLIKSESADVSQLTKMMVPDGFAIEIIGLNRKPDHPSLHHVGLILLNSGKSMGFYGNLLGAKFPETLPQWLSGDIHDADVGGHGWIIRLINGAFPEAAAQFTC
jgi:hypothetical protein